MEQKRITLKMKKPNPLFEKWLIEWRDREKFRQSKSVKCYQDALKSLRLYPLPLPSGKACMLLKGFGPKLCQMLDDKLLEYKLENKKQTDEENNLIVPEINVKASKYSPVTGSGTYSLLLALYHETLKDDSKDYMLKDELIEAAQPFCNKSFSWTSINTLINKQLVVKSGKPLQYSLTQDGTILAKKLCDENKIALPAHVTAPVKRLYDDYKITPPIQEIAPTKRLCDENRVPHGTQKGCNINFQEQLVEPTNHIISTDNKVFKKYKSDTQLSSQKRTTKNIKSVSSFNLDKNKTDTDQLVFLEGGLFEIILLVDTAETGGKKVLDDEFLEELVKLSVPYEVRNIKIGDYTWVARKKGTTNELVLPYIIERKRLDDFCKSIKDGRFHEQKFRLKKSGIENLIYLVENLPGIKNGPGLPVSTLHQAAVNTLIQDGFNVKFTRGLKGTAEYLSCMTAIIENIFQTKTLISCPKSELPSTSIEEDVIPLMSFTEFNQNASKIKRFKVQDLFIKQLLQLRGVSVEKAIAITKYYPTPRHLQQKYLECTKNEGEKFLANIQFGQLGKKIGPAISKTIFQLYTSEKY